MDIPIQNIYFLLCYAWDKLEERDVVEVDPVGTTSLLDLFARVLANGTRHLVRRGFDRGYVAQHERTARLRGRIAFEEAISSGTLRTGILPCSFDELSHNVLHNRILKATMWRLANVDELARESAEELALLCRLLHDVQDIELTSRVFGQVQLHRNNQFYDFLLKICELIYGHLLISEEHGTSRFSDFVRDEHEMRRLFEDFVRNFYDIETAYEVRRENIPWRWTPDDQIASDLLPRMQTDVSLISDSRRMIIECKFTPKAVQRNYEAEKLRSEHLYQLSAYLANLDGPFADTCEGVILYPTVEAPLSASYGFRGHRISVKTVNLDQPWQLIHKDLLQLVA